MTRTFSKDAYSLLAKVRQTKKLFLLKLGENVRDYFDISVAFKSKFFKNKSLRSCLKTVKILDKETRIVNYQLAIILYFGKQRSFLTGSG